MARPIDFVPPPQNGAGAADIALAVEQHAAAIVSALELLQLLHDRGVIDLMRGMLGAGDKLVDAMSSAADTPETIRAIRNFILLTKFFASIPPDVLNSLVQTAVEGASREQMTRAPSLFQLLRRLGSKDSRHTLSVALDLLEGVGRGL
jgi:uncharacterized protein YjgD (DUF1641 family)